MNWVPDGWLSGEAARPLIAERLARVAEWARYRHSQAKGADAELLDSVAAGLEAQLRARRKSGESGRNANAEARTRRARRRLRHAGGSGTVACGSAHVAPAAPMPVPKSGADTLEA